MREFLPLLPSLTGLVLCVVYVALRRIPVTTHPGFAPLIPVGRVPLSFPALGHGIDARLLPFPRLDPRASGVDIAPLQRVVNEDATRCLWPRPDQFQNLPPTTRLRKRLAAHGQHYLVELESLQADSPPVPLSESLCFAVAPPNTNSLPWRVVKLEGSTPCDGVANWIGVHCGLAPDVAWDRCITTDDLESSLTNSNMTCTPVPHCCDQLDERSVTLRQNGDTLYFTPNTGDLLLQGPLPEGVQPASLYLQPFQDHHMLVSVPRGSAARNPPSGGSDPPDVTEVIGTFAPPDSLTQALPTGTEAPFHVLRFTLEKQGASDGVITCPLEFTGVEQYDQTSRGWSTIEHPLAGSWVARCEDHYGLLS